MSQEKIEELFFQSPLKFENESGLKKFICWNFCQDSFNVWILSKLRNLLLYRAQIFVGKRSTSTTSRTTTTSSTSTMLNLSTTLERVEMLLLRLKARGDWLGDIIGMATWYLFSTRLIPTNDDKMLLALKCLSNRLVSHKSWFLLNTLHGWWNMCQPLRSMFSKNRFYKKNLTLQNRTSKIKEFGETLKRTRNEPKYT